MKMASPKLWRGQTLLLKPANAVRPKHTRADRALSVCPHRNGMEIEKDFHIRVDRVADSSSVSQQMSQNALLYLSPGS